jgi:hypothetical protein
MQCNLPLMFKLVSKLRTPTCKWQGRGGNTTLTKQNKVVVREGQQLERNNKNNMIKTTNVRLTRT